MINQIIPEDDGIYQCQAENQLGSVLAMARLIVVMSDNRPSAPRNVRADTMSSSAILLAWERPVYNSDKVIAYSVHYMKTEGEWQRLYTIVKHTILCLVDLAYAKLTVRIILTWVKSLNRATDAQIQKRLALCQTVWENLSLVSWQPFLNECQMKGAAKFSSET